MGEGPLPRPGGDRAFAEDQGPEHLSCLFGAVPALQHPEDMADADLAELESLVRPVGFYRAKAKAIKEIARLVAERGGVPKDIDEMTKWPMVGRKTANCVMTYAFKEPAICVDTHVHRISNRLGLVHCDTPDETEMTLRKGSPRRCGARSTGPWSASVRRYAFLETLNARNAP